MKTLRTLKISPNAPDTNSVWLYKGEKQIRERQAQAQKEQLEAQQQIAAMQQQQKEAELLQKEEANIRDNQTKIIIAQIQSEGGPDEEDGIMIDDYSPEAKANLAEKIRESDEKLDRKSTRLNSSHSAKSRMPSSA